MEDIGSLIEIDPLRNNQTEIGLLQPIQPAWNCVRDGTVVSFPSASSCSGASHVFVFMGRDTTRIRMQCLTRVLGEEHKERVCYL